jgi:hypothetical protein
MMRIEAYWSSNALIFCISLAEPEIFTRNRDTQSYDGTFALDVLSHMTAHPPLIYSVI